MDGQTVDKIINALQPIADKLGEGARYLWYVYYRQSIIEGIVSILVSAVLLVVTVVAAIVATRYLRKALAYAPTDWLDETRVPWFVIGGIAAAVAVFALSAGLTNFFGGLQHVLNPGYYALHHLMIDAGNVA